MPSRLAPRCRPPAERWRGDAPLGLGTPGSDSPPHSKSGCSSHSARPMRPSPKYGGTGLGLAICRNLVAPMGGHICGKARPDKAPRSTLPLPWRRSGPAHRGSQGQRHFAASYPVSPGAVLCFARRTRLAGGRQPHEPRARPRASLRMAGMRVELVDNGQMALDYLIRDADFAVVLMDCQMPVLTATVPPARASGPT